MRAARVLAVALVLAASCSRAGDDGGSGGASAAADPRGAPLPLPATGTADTTTVATPRGSALVSGDSAPGAREVIAEPLQWTADAVISRLRDAGLAPVQQGSIDAGAIGVPGIRLAVANGAGEVQAFILADPDAVGLAMRRVDPARLSSGGRTATTITDNNMGAIVLTADEKVRERIRFALIARGTGR